MPNIYDTILALIPTTGTAVGGLLSLTGIDPHSSVVAGAGAAAFLVLLALFVWPPGGSRPSFMDSLKLVPHQ